MKIFLVSVVLLHAVLSFANVTGSDIQNFNPTTNGLDFVTVQSSETLEPGILNIGLFLNYAVNVMPNYEDANTASRTNFQDKMLGGDINIGLGLNKNWDVGFSIPQVYSQTSQDNQNVYVGEISQTGFTEYRINSKYRFLGDEAGGLAFVGSVNFDQVVDNPFTGTDPGPTFNFELAWDTSVDRVAYGLNLGYRKRNPGEAIVATPPIPIEPFEDQFIASAAVSYLLASVDTKLIGEVYGSFPVNTPDMTSDRDVSSMELLVGVKKDIRHDIALHAGAATEVYHGSSSPDWRVYTGLNWNFGPIWSERTADTGVKRLEDDNSEYFASKSNPSTEKFVAGDVLFSFGSAELSSEFETILILLAEYLKKSQGFKAVVVEGYTDSVGSEEYNRKLSQLRADNVRAFLIGRGGLPGAKVKSMGYGEARPIADNANFQGRSRNRRVEFNITR